MRILNVAFERLSAISVNKNRCIRSGLEAKLIFHAEFTKNRNRLVNTGEIRFADFVSI